MNVEYDERADAMYIRLKDAEIATTREVEDHLIADLDRDRKMIGIQLLFVSDYLALGDVRNFTVTNLRSTA